LSKKKEKTGRMIRTKPASGGEKENGPGTNQKSHEGRNT